MDKKIFSRLRFSKKAKARAGFSLIEMLISIFIMIVIATAVSAVLAKTFSVKKAARESQADLQEGRTAIETIAKNMRMSSYAQSPSSDEIVMHNSSQNICMKYNFSTEGSITESRGTSTDTLAENCSDLATGYGPPVKIISANVDGGGFVIDETDRTPPSMKIGRGIIWLKMGNQILQTTVSFRDYDGIIE